MLLGTAAFAVLLVGRSASAQIGPTLPTACVQAETFAFSTEVDFLTKGPTPPDGNPLISDGDLIANAGGSCLVCARNGDLLALFGSTPDLGLDAVDVIVDGEDRVVVFSTELDYVGDGVELRAGDLLTRDGAILPNRVLLQNFSIGDDLGIDAVHCVGEARDLVTFWDEARQRERLEWLEEPTLLLDLLEAHDVDLWISTEGTAPSPSTPAFLDGDLLSVRTGNVVARQDQLLPAPAGIPSPGVDFGLDAVTGDRGGQVDRLEFSVEVRHPDAPAFGASDRLAYGLAWQGSGRRMVLCFEPVTLELGLDAASSPLPEPGWTSMLAVGLLSLGARAGGRRSRPG